MGGIGNLGDLGRLLDTLVGDIGEDGSIGSLLDLGAAGSGCIDWLLNFAARGRSSDGLLDFAAWGRSINGLLDLAGGHNWSSTGGLSSTNSHGDLVRGSDGDGFGTARTFTSETSRYLLDLNRADRPGGIDCLNDGLGGVESLVDSGGGIIVGSGTGRISGGIETGRVAVAPPSSSRIDFSSASGSRRLVVILAVTVVRNGSGGGDECQKSELDGRHGDCEAM